MMGICVYFFAVIAYGKRSIKFYTIFKTLLYVYNKLDEFPSLKHYSIENKMEFVRETYYITQHRNIINKPVGNITMSILYTSAGRTAERAVRKQNEKKIKNNVRRPFL